MVISLKSQNDPKVKDAVYIIGLSDGSLFSIKTSYMSSIYRDNISAILNKDLSLEEEEDVRFAGCCFNAEQSALHLIARAEQSSVNLSFKLEKRGHKKSCVKRVIERLIEEKILSDTRYAEIWLQNRLSRKIESPRSLVAGLCAKGMSRKDADRVLKSLLSFDEELKLVKKYVEKNSFSIKDEKNMVKAKLKFEGFSTESIEALLEEDL